MPPSFVPKRSAVHRVAAIALYRALLLQCRLQASNINELRNIVRNRFRDNQNVQSPNLLSRGFRAGYEALDVLAEAAKDGNAHRTRIQDMIAQIPIRLKKPPKPPIIAVHAAPRKAKKPHNCSVDFEKSRPNEGQFISLEIQHSILLRPYAEVKGKRHVPVWTRAQGIPFLRIKKPQPPALSAAIRCRIKRRQKWVNSRVEMDNRYIPMGENEDVWDEIVTQQLYSGERGAEEDGRADARTSWAEEPTKIRDDITRKLQDEGRASAELSEEMFKVVEREKVLAWLESQRDKGAQKHEMK